MKTLYLLCGLSFSGKSTLASAMCRQIGCSLVSLDDINHERGFGFGGAGIPPHEWEQTHHVAIARLQELMPGGKDIVLDDTNCFRWIRDRFRAVAVTHGYRTIVAYLDISLSQLRLRMQRNDASRERPQIKEEIFAQSIRTFQPPGADELTVIFADADTPADWLQARLLPSVESWRQANHTFQQHP